MNNLIAIAAPGPVGPTFLEWSIYYLTTQEKYFHATVGWQQLVDNPLSTGDAQYKNIPIGNDFRDKYASGLINAHHHKKNVTFGFNQLTKLLNQVNSEDVGLLAWHLMTPSNADAISEAGLTKGTLGNNTDLYKKALTNNYTKCINHCLDNNIKVIFVEIDERANLYFVNDRRPVNNVVLLTENAQAYDVAKIHDDYQKAFYGETDDELTMDRREKYALDRRPFENLKDASYFNFDRSKPHYNLNCLSLWYNGEVEIRNIFKFLGLTIDEQRFNRWVELYKQWQKIHIKFLEFSYKFDHIIKSIINNWYYDIGTLTFDEEVVIIHTLIYKYNQNINLWQLPKLPSNAQDIHKLLIPCVHPVPDIYNCKTQIT